MNDATPQTPGPAATAAAPAVIKPFVNRFQGAIDPDDIIMPIGLLIQGNPTEREKYPNALPGTFINNITHAVLPDKFIPLITKKEWVYFNPQDDTDPNFPFDKAFGPKKMIWKSDNPNDPKVIEYSKWRGTKENPIKPLATAMIKFICYFPGFDLPVMISFKSTGYRSGKNLLTSILANGANGEQYYRLQSTKENEDGNVWLVPNAFLIGKASDDDSKKASELYEMIAKARNVQVHGEDESDAAAA